MGSWGTRHTQLDQLLHSSLRQSLLWTLPVYTTGAASYQELPFYSDSTPVAAKGEKVELEIVGRFDLEITSSRFGNLGLAIWKFRVGDLVIARKYVTIYKVIMRAKGWPIRGFHKFACVCA